MNKKIKNKEKKDYSTIKKVIFVSAMILFAIVVFIAMIVFLFS